jgi:hypothetical protein
VHVSNGTGNMTIWSGDEMVDRDASEQQNFRDLLSRGDVPKQLVVIDNVRDEDGWDFLGRRSSSPTVSGSL